MIALPMSALLACVVPTDELKIDPATLVAWREACTLCTRHKDEVWPGYALGDLPALILKPGVEEVLVHHPSPPAGFVRFEGASPLGAVPLFLRRGTTTFDSAMNTSTTLAGIRTLVVADRSTDPGIDDAWLLGVMVHEGFHAWAEQAFRHPPSNEIDLADYPDLDAELNAHLELEGNALIAAVKAATQDEREEQALLFLAERVRRRARVPAAAVRWEDGNELNEGLATYCEMRAHELWARDGVGELTRATLPSVADPKVFARRFDDSLNLLKNAARGTLSINGSPHGPAAVRRRGYLFGFALGWLLDRLGADWKGEAARGRPLTEIARAALADPQDAELAERADALEKDSDFAALVQAKEKNAQVAENERRARIDAVLLGSGTLVRVDVAAFAGGGPLLPSSYTPFGILRVDADRRLFSQSTTHFDFGEAEVATTRDDVALIADQKRRELLVRTATGAREMVAALAGKKPLAYRDAALALRAPACDAELLNEREVRVTLRRADAR